jgi:hypothetical protein
MEGNAMNVAQSLAAPPLEVPEEVLEDRGHDNPLLNHLAILESRITQLESERNLDQKRRKTLEEARTIIERRKNRIRWIDVLRVERLVFSAYDDRMIEHQFKRLLAERDILEETVRKYYDQFASIIDNDEEFEKLKKKLSIHDIAMQLLDDLHRVRSEQHHKRFCVIEIRKNKIKHFWFGFRIFVFVLVVYLCELFLRQEFGVEFQGGSSWKVVSNLFSSFVDPMIAVVSGLFGAAFSILQTREANLEALTLEALEKARQRRALWVRTGAGVGGALIVYYFLLADFLQQPMLPGETLSKSLTEFDVSLSPQQHARLAVICFAAGFSERLVPSVVQQFSERLKLAPTPRA